VIQMSEISISQADMKKAQYNFFNCFKNNPREQYKRKEISLESYATYLRKQQTIRRIRQYSGQEVKGKELFNLFGVDYAEMS